MLGRIGFALQLCGFCGFCVLFLAGTLFVGGSLDRAFRLMERGASCQQAVIPHSQGEPQ